MDTPFKISPDIEVIPSHFPVPGIGFLPVNAFVLKAKEPVLVDTGLAVEGKEFMEALKSIIDPRDLKWVWLTHDDADHTGSIQQVLETATNARLVANSLAVLRMSTVWVLPMDRVYWINPGESIDIGDRRLTAVRPPLFDNPTTIGVYDNKTEAFFSADCFGALIPSPAWNVDDVETGSLVQGMINWGSGDNPWIHMVEPDVFGQSLNRIRQMAAKIVLSAHLPPAQGKTDQLLDTLMNLPTAHPFVAPNQAALEQMLAQMKSAG